jgi:hypothetical protein
VKCVCFEYLVRPALWWQLTWKLHVTSVYAILCYSCNVKNVVSVTSHTVWRHDAIRYSWWRILPYTAVIHMARLRVGDTRNFGDEYIGVLRRIIASQCVFRGVGHCNRISGTVFLCAWRHIRKYMYGRLPDHLGVPNREPQDGHEHYAILSLHETGPF